MLSTAQPIQFKLLNTLFHKLLNFNCQISIADSVFLNIFVKFVTNFNPITHLYGQATQLIILKQNDLRSQPNLI